MQFSSIFATRVSALADTTIRDTLALATKPGVISLGGGIPNPSLFPLARVRSILADLSDAELQTGLQYSGTQGLLSIRQQIADMLSEQWGRAISPNHVLITTGSQQALDIVAKTFIEPGDAVAIENPSYLAAVSAFQTNAPQFHPVALDQEGIDCKKLEAVLIAHSPKLLYAIPTFQNPTGCVWSEKNRKQVVSLTTKHNCLVVEDDPYSELYFGTEKPPKSLAAQSEDVIYLGTFSKTLLPGLRIGFMVADPELISVFTLIKQSMDLHSSTFSQVLLSKLLDDQSWYQNHLQTLRSYYRKQQGHMVQVLKTHLPRTIEWSTPAGGLFVWLKIPGADSRKLLNKAVAKGIAFMPGYAFYAGKPDYETIRLTFATATEQDIEQAVRKLASVF